MLHFVLKINFTVFCPTQNESKCSRVDQVKFFKVCLPQILRGTFFNILALTISLFFQNYLPCFLLVPNSSIYKRKTTEERFTENMTETDLSELTQFYDVHYVNTRRDYPPIGQVYRNPHETKETWFTIG